MNPVALVLGGLVRATLTLILQGTDLALSEVVFRPLTWAPEAAMLLNWSRNLAWTAVGGAIIVASLGTVWPILVNYRPRGSWGAILVRAVAAALIVDLVPWSLKTLLQVNNGILQSFAKPTFSISGWNVGLLAASPLLMLGLVAVLAMMVLYLSVMYVLRAVQLFWTAALIPWFAVGWLATGRDDRLADHLREVLVLIFMQAGQAMAWWLTVHLLAQAQNLGALLVACGGLWFMTRIPHELRRIAGLGPSIRGPLPW